jgi:hypothetical protein
MLCTLAHMGVAMPMVSEWGALLLTLPDACAQRVMVDNDRARIIGRRGTRGVQYYGALPDRIAVGDIANGLPVDAGWIHELVAIAST